MTPQETELARRAVAAVEISKWPNWTPVTYERDGKHGRAVMLTYEGERCIGYLGCVPLGRFKNVLPLLSTPAGLGSLMAVVREAYKGKIVITRGNGWAAVETDERDFDCDSGSPIEFMEALITALEASP